MEHDDTFDLPDDSQTKRLYLAPDDFEPGIIITGIDNQRVGYLWDGYPLKIVSYDLPHLIATFAGDNKVVLFDSRVFHFKRVTQEYYSGFLNARQEYMNSLNQPQQGFPPNGGVPIGENIGSTGDPVINEIMKLLGDLNQPKYGPDDPDNMQFPDGDESSK